MKKNTKADSLFYRSASCRCRRHPEESPQIPAGVRDRTKAVNQPAVNVKNPTNNNLKEQQQAAGQVLTPGTKTHLERQKGQGVFDQEPH